MNYDELDPGIRDTVRLLVNAGFDTSDSGDGVSKPPDEIEIPFPHVAAGVQPDEMHHHAHRMMDVLGPEWEIEATYWPRSGRAMLLATKPQDTVGSATVMDAKRSDCTLQERSAINNLQIRPDPPKEQP